MVLTVHEPEPAHLATTQESEGPRVQVPASAKRHHYDLLMRKFPKFGGGGPVWGPCMKDLIVFGAYLVPLIFVQSQHTPLLRALEF